MSLPARIAHLTLPTRKVEETARFLERTLGLRRLEAPENSPIEVVWLELGEGQSVHVFHAPAFAVSGHEGEFGRHVALFLPLGGFPSLKRRLAAEGAPVYPAKRSTDYGRFFFTDPVNGYVFEIIESPQRKVPGSGARNPQRRRKSEASRRPL